MIDKTYARKLAARILKNILDSVQKGYITDVRNRLISDYADERDSILDEMLVKLWDELMSYYKAYEQGRPLLVSEKALACLIRKGVDRKDISLNVPTSSIQLKNLIYYVKKEGVGCSSKPCASAGHHNSLPMRWVALSGEDFADFMFDFDELASEFIAEVDRKLMEFKIKAKQYEILSQTVNRLGEVFLRNEGIQWHIGTDFSEEYTPVTFYDGKHQSINEKIPVVKLAEVFQSIPERMEKQPLIPKSGHTSVFLWDDPEISVI